MSKAPPSFDFFPSDFLAGTMTLTHTELSCYIRLLCYQWDNGHIPPAEIERMNICNIADQGHWRAIWERIRIKFKAVSYGDICTCDSDLFNLEMLVFVNPRMHEMREKQIPRWFRNREIYRENGAKGGRPKGKTKRLTKAVSKSKPIPEGGRGKEEGKKKKKRSTFVPPTIEELLAYCREKGYQHLEPEEFIGHYGGKGWKVGNQPMKDWRLAAGGWNSRNKKRAEADSAPIDRNATDEDLENWNPHD
jgi:hypothetical protein